MRVDRTANRKVGVVGAARSGIAAALLLNRHGANVFVSDSKDPQLLGDAVDTLRSRGIEFETGGNTSRVFDGMDYVVISPGIPPEAPIVTQMEAAGIPTISEIELGYWLCDGRIAAITGSNGKTTTTALTGEIFKLSGKPTFVAGNIGAPFCDICDEVPKNGWVIPARYSCCPESDTRPSRQICRVLQLCRDEVEDWGESIRERCIRCKFR
jgi:UDP-N-acetylmuramoylalanine--D-glutamate ligase